ncbi:hypothetical protein SBBP2_1550009 [Burkholderiales bacterium]|nr:hypothetical protein SBBP2_1550009 [Burkholderiales bacterium]
MLERRHGFKWRGLPKRFGNWHTIYARMNRWSKLGVLDRVFEKLQHAQIVRIKIESVCRDADRVPHLPAHRGIRLHVSGADRPELSVHQAALFDRCAGGCRAGLVRLLPVSEDRGHLRSL